MRYRCYVYQIRRYYKFPVQRKALTLRISTVHGWNCCSFVTCVSTFLSFSNGKRKLLQLTELLQSYNPILYSYTDLVELLSIKRYKFLHPNVGILYEYTLAYIKSEIKVHVELIQIAIRMNSEFRVELFSPRVK